MSARIRKITLASMISLTALGSALYMKNAEAIWPLSYSWTCQGSSSTQVLCGFTVTNPGPSGYNYQWQFGDGAQTGRLTSTTTSHSYAVSAGQSGNFTVTLTGYASSSSQSPDNIIGCTVSFGNDFGVGGGPPYTGNCS